MAIMIALALGGFTLGAAAGITGVVSMAIRTEDNNLTLTGEAPGPVTRVGRRLTGAYARAPRRTAAAHQRAAPA